MKPTSNSTTTCKRFLKILIIGIILIIGVQTITSCSGDDNDDGDNGNNGGAISSSSSVVGGGGTSSSGGGAGSSSSIVAGSSADNGGDFPFESTYTQEAFPVLTNASEFIGDWKSGSYIVTLESNGSWAMKLSGVVVGSYSGKFLVSGNTAYFYASEAGGYYLNGYGTKSGSTMSMDGGFESLATSWTKQATEQPPTTPGPGENIAEIYRAGSFEGAVHCENAEEGHLHVDFFVTEDKIEWAYHYLTIVRDEGDCTDNIPSTGILEDISTNGGGELKVLGSIPFGQWSYVYAGENLIGIVWIRDEDNSVNFVIGKKQLTAALPELSVLGFNANTSEFSESVREMAFDNEE